MSDLDQSNAQPDPIRMIALNYAMNAHAHVQFGGPDMLIDTARDIYLFLSERDPLIDVVMPATEEDPGKVVLLDHYRQA